MGQATRNIANSFSTSGIITSTGINNSSLGNITDLSLGGSLILLAEATASSDSSIEFTSSIDSTYDEYLFVWNNVHPANDASGKFSYNFSTDGGSNFNVTKTSTMDTAFNNEAGNSYGYIYYANGDAEQSTGVQNAYEGGLGNDNDQICCGFLRLYQPSNTTFVKHYQSEGCNYQDSDYINRARVNGYCNTTSAVNAVQFKMSDSGNIDDGHFQMFGVK